MAVNPSNLIKTANLTLFAFYHSPQETEESPGPQPVPKGSEGLQAGYSKLADALAVPDLKDLPFEESSNDRRHIFRPLLKEDRDNKRYRQYKTGAESHHSGLTVQVYPGELHDARILELTLSDESEEGKTSEQQVDLNRFRIDEGSIFPLEIPHLGQSFVFFAKAVEEPAQHLADSLASCLLSGDANRDPIYFPTGVGRVFGSPVYEYIEDISTEPQSNRNLWLWLETTSVARETLQYKGQLATIRELLCYRSKILFAYAQSRQCNTDANKVYDEVEKKAGELEENLRGTNEVEKTAKLKDLLLYISRNSFYFLKHLRNFREHQITIGTNAKNYLNCLQRLENHRQPDDDFQFLYEFYERTQNQFIKQIDIDLDYLNPGRDIAKQMTETIRGYIDVMEAERDRKLRDTVEAIGIGVGASAVVASNAGLLVLPWRFPWQSDRSAYPHPALNSIGLSALIGIAAYWLVRAYKQSPNMPADTSNRTKT